MTHFPLVLIRRPDQNADDILRPYSSTHLVEPYETTCRCVGQKAYLDSLSEVLSEGVFTIDRGIEEFENYPLVIQLYAYYQSVIRDEDMDDGSKNHVLRSIVAALEDLWEVIVFLPIENMTRKKMEAHPLKDSPDPECPMCHGTGKFTTNANPNAKFYSYYEGGRWANAIGDRSTVRGDKVNRFFVPVALILPTGEYHSRTLCSNDGKSGHVEWIRFYLSATSSFLSPDFLFTVFDCAI